MGEQGNAGAGTSGAGCISSDLRLFYLGSSDFAQLKTVLHILYRRNGAAAAGLVQAEDTRAFKQQLQGNSEVSRRSKVIAGTSTNIQLEWRNTQVVISLNLR